ncbi:MAG TPA: hypothetical protein VFG73_10160 [Rhodanobacteraceae bacterium]|nr:hypothetical protein [Rhodanobacteraceae bacterium]
MMSLQVSSFMLSVALAGTAAAAPPPHAAAAAAAASAPSHPHAQSQRMNTPQLLAAERTAMAPLAKMSGIWRGTATVTMRGQHHEITQTERVGPFLDGTLMVMEGRGYNADGSLGFNAFGVVSYQPRDQSYHMHSWAQGYSGDFPLKVTLDGFSWSIPAGPATMRYTATIKCGHWHEIGERLMPGKPPVRILEMDLQRVGSTTWPAGNAVPMRPPGG